MTANTETAKTATDATETAADIAPGTDAAPATGRPSGAVWDALTANPGVSVAELAALADLPESATRRTLTALELDGHATRTPGGRKGGKRAPDAWHAVTGTASSDSAAPEEEITSPPAPLAEADETGTEDNSGAAAISSGEDDDQLDEGAVRDACEALDSMAAAIKAAREALETGDRTAALGAVEEIYGGSAKTRRLVRTAANCRRRNASGRPHALPGELRAMVAAHLTAHPGIDFTPHQIGNVIGRSAGAVSNALDRLVEHGAAVITCERPRRFTASGTDSATS